MYPVDNQYLGVCETHGKRLYASRKQAKAAIRRIPKNGPMREYRCQVHGHLWHVGRLPPATVYGLKTAAEVYDSGVA